VKATNVIGRFLSLLDVALILLGVLMIVLMHAQPRTPRPPISPVDDGSDADKDVGVVFAYAGWKDDEAGRCFLLDDVWKIVREIRTNSSHDIQQILAERKPPSAHGEQVVLLLFSGDGWYSDWDEKKLAEIRMKWNVNVVPVYNVPLP
jgi:hypothetical protein